MRAMPRSRILLSYAGAGLLLFVIFLVAMAPPSMVQRSIEGWAGERGLTMRFEGFETDLPTGFEFGDLHIITGGSGERFYHVTNGSVRCRPWELLKSRLGLVLSGTLSEGQFQARLLSAPWFSFDSISSELQVEDILLTEATLMSGLVRAALLNGNLELNHRKVSGRAPGSQAEGSILLSGVSLLPREHGTAEIMLRDLNAEISYELKDGIVVLRSSRFKGDGIEGTLSGTILLAPTLGRSRLDLRLDARLDATRVAPRFAAFIPRGVPWRLSITGELQAPVYALR
jgi:type II secretion system protein N